MAIAAAKLWRVVFVLIAALLVIGLAVYHWKPRQAPAPLPERKPEMRYSYYRIVDQATGKTLMVISSSPVTVGDELLTGDNRRYVVVRMVGNLAYAKFVEQVRLEKSGTTILPQRKNRRLFRSSVLSFGSNPINRLLNRFMGGFFQLRNGEPIASAIFQGAGNRFRFWLPA